jgi:hypothetical protein
VHVEAARLLDPLKIRRRESHHRFAERDEIHAQSYARREALTSVARPTRDGYDSAALCYVIPQAQRACRDLLRRTRN